MSPVKEESEIDEIVPDNTFANNEKNTKVDVSEDNGALVDNEVKELTCLKSSLYLCEEK